jgi:hypothetical protein
VIFFMGVSLPIFARWIDKRLKVRRAKRMLKKLMSWRDRINEKRFDGSPTDFYYELRPYLTDATLKNIMTGTEEDTTRSILQDIDSLTSRWTKAANRKDLEKWLAGIRLKRRVGFFRTVWDWWTSVESNGSH